MHKVLAGHAAVASTKSPLCSGTAECLYLQTGVVYILSQYITLHRFARMGSEYVRTHAKWLLMALSHGFSVGPVCRTKSRRPVAGRSGWHSPSVRRLHMRC